MNAPFPLNPDVGEWSGGWVWNGARWVASPTTGLRVLTQVFTASGPYMPTPGLVSCVVECIGGGGGGGQAGTGTGLGNVLLTGAGGGSGGYSRKSLPAALVRGGVLVTVGEGGAAQQPGGQTLFGALCLADGGGGGSGNAGTSPDFGQPGAPAAPGIGDVAFPGAGGEGGLIQAVPTGFESAISCQGGRGGWIFGGSTASVAEPGQGIAGIDGTPNSGAGGSGAAINQITSTNVYNGGAGGSGLCIVTEYVVGDRDQPLTEWRPPLDVNVTVRPPKPWPPGPPVGPWWPPGWPPGWGPNRPWPPGWGPQPPWQPFEGQTIEGQEYEAGVDPYSQDPEEDP